MNTLEAKLTKVLQAAVDNQEAAGYNALVRQGGVELAYAQAGYADRETKKPIARDSIFRLYSQSKPITSAGVMILLERGLIDLMDPVEAYLPGWANPQVLTPDGLVPARRSVTICDLLGMTAGCCYPDVDLPGRHMARLFEENQAGMDTGSGMSTVQFCSEMGKQPLTFQPGSAFRYSVCADVLGAIIEVVTGKSLADFLQEEIFTPLGMKDTGFCVPAEKKSRLVTAYERTPDGLTSYSVKHLCVGNYDTLPAFLSGGAGLVSTLDDYAKFASMLLGKGEYNGVRILQPGTVAWMAKPQVASTGWDGLTGFGYGKLMRICNDPGAAQYIARPGEFGWDGWLGTYFAVLPDLDMTIQVNLNVKDSGTTAAVRKLRNVVLSGY